MKTSRTSADEERILGKIEAQLTPAYQVGPCVTGHDIAHVERMIRIADIIADQKEVDLFLLKLAIWFHNIDRSSFFNFRSDEEIAQYVKKVLSHLGFTEEEIALIADAVEKHGLFVDESDSTLHRYLKDCDMLDMGAIGILRIPALHAKELPTYTLADFIGREKRFVSEKDRPTSAETLTSLLHGLDRCLAWKGMLRTPKAKEFGRKRFAFMKEFRKEVERELKELGVL